MICNNRNHSLLRSDDSAAGKMCSQYQPRLGDAVFPQRGSHLIGPRRPDGQTDRVFIFTRVPVLFIIT